LVQSCCEAGDQFLRFADLGLKDRTYQVHRDLLVASTYAAGTAPMGKVRVGEYKEGRNKRVTVVPVYRVRQTLRVKKRGAATEGNTDN
jgi:hypothetical protein